MTKWDNEGWVPVHPERGPDWAAMTLYEDEAIGELVEGYEWKRVRLIVADGEDASK